MKNLLELPSRLNKQNKFELSCIVMQKQFGDKWVELSCPVGKFGKKYVELSCPGKIFRKNKVELSCPAQNFAKYFS